VIAAADVYINITYTIDEREKEERETRQPRGSEQDPTPQGRRGSLLLYSNIITLVTRM
jgi:hypothetical protein